MNELVQSLNNISEILSENALPKWVSVVEIVIPIILTIVIIVQAVIQQIQNQKSQQIIHEQNQDLQRIIHEQNQELLKNLNNQNHELLKNIHNREVRLQNRENVLQIYNAFVNSHQVVKRGGISAEITFAYPQNTSIWADDLEITSNDLALTMNRVNLFFSKSNSEFINVLRACVNKFEQIHQAVIEYVRSGGHDVIRNASWNNITQTYGIMKGDYWALQQNQIAMGQFLQLCETNNVKEIKKLAAEYLEMLKDENFDVYFEKYLSIEEELL